jgi:two-component system, OmpR family, sensor kinase
MSVRTRLTLWNVGILTLVLLVMGGLLRLRVQAQWERALDAELQRRTRILPRRMPPLSMRPRMRPPMPKIPIFDPAGRSLSGDLTAPDLVALRQALKDGQDRFTDRGVERVLSHPFTLDDGTRLVFQTSESKEPMQRELATLTRELLLLLPIGVLAAALGGLFLTARALQPVRAMTEAANRIEAADLAQRLPVSGKDEFARLTETLNKMLGRLEAAFERQRRFVADASHELKTPLTIVTGAAQLGLTDEAASPQAHKLFVRIDEAAGRMGRLVGGLLELAKGASETAPLPMSPILLQTLFQEVADEAALLHPTGPPVRLSISASMALGNEDALRRLMLNLTDNALRHTPPTGSLLLGAEKEGGKVRLYVCDSGSGIAEEVLPRLGEPFYRPDAARARRDGGTGLGLAICMQLAARHGSALEIRSAPGEGTEVWFYLPVADHGVK